MASEFAANALGRPALEVTALCFEVKKEDVRRMPSDIGKDPARITHPAVGVQSSRSATILPEAPLVISAVADVERAQVGAGEVGSRHRQAHTHRVVERLLDVDRLHAH